MKKTDEKFSKHQQTFYVKEGNSYSLFMCEDEDKNETEDEMFRFHIPHS